MKKTKPMQTNSDSINNKHIDFFYCFVHIPIMWLKSTLNSFTSKEMDKSTIPCKLTFLKITIITRFGLKCIDVITSNCIRMRKRLVSNRRVQKGAIT